MASSSGGIGIGTIIFIVVVGYNIFFDDNDKNTENVKSNKTTIKQTVDQTIKDVKNDSKKLIDKANKSFKQTKNIQEEPAKKEHVIANDKESIPSLKIPNHSKSSSSPTFKTIQ